MKNAIKTIVFIAAFVTAITAMTACNKGKGEAQTADNAVQRETGVLEKEEATVTAQGASDSPASKLNGSWLITNRPGIDGYYKFNSGVFEYYNSRTGTLINSKGTYTLSGDIITFITTRESGLPFDLHYDVLYTKDEVKAHYETSTKLTDELIEEYFPFAFITTAVKYIQDANPDNDIFISQGGIIYKRILANGKVSATAHRPSA